MSQKKQCLFAILILVLLAASDSVWAVGKPTANQGGRPEVLQIYQRGYYYQLLHAGDRVGTALREGFGFRLL